MKKIKNVRIKQRFYSEEEYNKLKAERDELESQYKMLQKQYFQLSEDYKDLILPRTLPINPLGSPTRPLNPTNPYEITCDTNPRTNSTNPELADLKDIKPPRVSINTDLVETVEELLKGSLR